MRDLQSSVVPGNTPSPAGALSFALTLFTCVAALLCAGCGQKGPLTLPQAASAPVSAPASASAASR